jgi:predicted HAD superfamily Cof-like phosphohydrolase
MPRRAEQMTAAQKRALTSAVRASTAARDRARAADARRDEVIAAVRSAGVSSRDIAEVVGISHQAVDKITAKLQEKTP